AVGALRVGIAITLYLSGQVQTLPGAPIPLWAYAGLSATFGALGTLLLVANRNDARAEWLGGVLLLIAAPLTGNPTRSSVLAGLGHVRPDTFLPPFLGRVSLPVLLLPPAGRADPPAARRRACGDAPALSA